MLRSNQSGSNASSGLIDPDETERHCSEMEVDHTDIRMQGYLNPRRMVRGEPSDLMDFCSYAFKYCLTEEEQKGIDIDMIFELFTQYLKIQSDYKVLTMGPWMSFYWFYDSISFQDPSKYKLELAWPLIVDDFVEWIREKQTQS
ncbi:unnamed protein product [Malus baccata var. baccata]